VPEMLNKLPEEGLSELPKSKRPEEIKRTCDPKYCRYHRIVSHPIENVGRSRNESYNLKKRERSH